QVRYFLLREVPFGNDGDFSHRAIVTRINSELANDLGNLAQRVLKMINASCGAAAPSPGPLTSADEALLAAAHSLHARVRQELGQQAFSKALDALWEVIGEGNRYVDDQKPWSLKKTDPARMNTVLYVLAETVRHLAILIQPFMPQACGRLLDLLGVADGDRNFAALHSKRLVPGTPLPPPPPQ